MKKLFLQTMMILSGCILLSCSSGENHWSVLSPSGNMRYTITLSETGSLAYTFDMLDSGNWKTLITPSPLGISRSDVSFTENLKFISATPSLTIEENYKLKVGKKLSIHSTANEITVTFASPTGQQVQVVARAFDDGAAFRYRFPKISDSTFEVHGESTAFVIAEEGKAWTQPYDKITTYSPGYERYYENGIPIGTSAPGEEGWCFPALFETPSAWIMITEAGAMPGYFASHLAQQADGRKYSIKLPEATEANNTVSNIATSTLPWDMPWRVIIAGKDLASMVETHAVTSLNLPSQIADDSWVIPGRATWSWWSEWSSPKNYAAMTPFIDLAAAMGWEYFLVDANWDMMTGGNIEQLISYARTKNVGILMWYNSGGPHNDVTERPRDIMNDPLKRLAEFRKLDSLGVKGVKVDFFQSDKPAIIQQYFDILRDAAQYKIMVNFHGCTMPRGWERTWPNLVCMEAVRGAECYAFDEQFPAKAVWYNTILPFTRNAVGSMDYTPVAFTNQKYPHQTSYGHELALSIVFESGILHYADRVAAYTSLPYAPKEFLKQIPTVWDETILLSGYPGKECVIARNHGDTWYIGGINGTTEEKTWEIDLKRLPQRDYTATIITDGATTTEFSTEAIVIKQGEKLKVNVLGAGGFAAVLR